MSGNKKVQAKFQNNLTPKIQVVENPQTSYKVGDRIEFKVNSPNYSGAVEYRVILWNNNLKTTSELWPNSPGLYYQRWKPSGKYAFPITWIVTNDMKPGSYRLTVLTRKAGSKASYESYVELPVFWVGEEGTNKDTDNMTDTQSLNKEMHEGEVEAADFNVLWNKANDKREVELKKNYTYNLSGYTEGFSKTLNYFTEDEVRSLLVKKNKVNTLTQAQAIDQNQFALKLFFLQTI
jgi:hypothetical protein